MLIIILYILLYVILDFSSNNYTEKYRKKYQSKWCLLFLCSFFCFRGLSVLNDTSHYYRYQENVISNISSMNSIFDVTWGTSVDVGFQVLQNFIAKYVSTEPYSLIFITALFCSVILIWFLNVYSKSIAFAIFVLAGLSFLFSFYAAMRQGIAASLFFIAVYLWDKKNKKVMPALLLGIAWLFHDSVIVCIIPFLMSYFRVSNRNVTRYILLLVIAVIALYPILTILSYSDSMYIEQAAERTSPAIAALLNFLFYFLLVIWTFCNNTKEYLNQHRYLFWASVTCIFFHLCALQILIFERFGLYFSIFVVLLFVNSLYEKSKKQGLKLFVILLLIIRTIIILEYRNEWHHLVPFNFYDFNAVYHETDFGY